MPDIKQYTIPIFVPEMACPFQCAFCDQEKISGQQHIPDESEMIQTIERHLRSFPMQPRRVELGFFGGSFTGIARREQEKYLSLVQPYINNGRIDAIRISTRPDYIDDEILHLLEKYHVTTIELGAQSMDDDVLKASQRGHSAQQVVDAAHLIRDRGFKLGLQMMIGLPGDSLEKAIKTAEKIIELKADCTRIYPALVIRDTRMHQWLEQGKYTPLSLEVAVQWTKHLMLLFEQSKVKVIRVGLHPSEGLLAGDELVAGPFHPSFRELVYTAIWGDLLQPLFNRAEKNSLCIEVSGTEINYAVGYKGQHRKRLMQVFRKVRFVASRDLHGRDFRVSGS